jgi:hypothetical protein
LNNIPANHRPHVTQIIGLPNAGGYRGNLPSAAHNTDPLTGAAAAGAVNVTEYYLPNAAGGRMTRRSQNGRMAFYYSAGGHAHNQYSYYLVTNNAGFPLLRGGYPVADRV